MKLRNLFFLMISLTILSCNGQSSKNVNTIEATAFAEKIKTTTSPQIIDVRTPEEFQAEHIDNAKNANILGDHFVSDVAQFDKTKAIFVYCKSGGRSKKATEKLQELGFKNIYELDGGFLKWNSAGLNKPSKKVVGMTSQEYSELLNTDQVVLIDFYADWCAPCKKMTPYLTKMQEDLKGSVVIIRLNADENKTLMNDMKIDVLPTLLLYKNKELKWKNSGYISEEDLKKQL